MTKSNNSSPMTKPMTSDSEEVYCDRCGAIADEGDKECWSCNHTVFMVREVTEEVSSTDGSANAKVSRKLAQEAQSEAPSVVDELDKLLISFAGAIRKEVLALGSNDPSYEVKPLFYPLKAKINRLIGDAYNKGYSDGRLVKPKYKVGDISGNYRITERFRRVGKNTKYKVVCILCDAPMFRYSNKFNLKHKECGAIKND